MKINYFFDSPFQKINVVEISLAFMKIQRLSLGLAGRQSVIDRISVHEKLLRETLRKWMRRVCVEKFNYFFKWHGLCKKVAL